MPSGPVAAALTIWVATRVGVHLLAWSGGYALGDSGSYLTCWQRWDTALFERIAADGYAYANDEAFFPGYPLVLRALTALGLHPALAGLLISLVAGGVAVAALARLAELEAPAGTGERAVLALVLSPAAVFLVAGYTEALFLAFALPAWLAAVRGHWWVGGVLAAGACGVRISGAFLAAALVVHFLTTPADLGGRRWRQLPALALPAVPLVSYAVYLHESKGSWLAWQTAQELGWGRSFDDPVAVLQRTWEAAFGDSQPAQFQVTFKMELVAMAVGVALTVALLAWRRWGEATYVGLSVVALSTSTWYFSVPRASLLWWPLWIALGALSLRSRLFTLTYLAVVAPLSAFWVVVFIAGGWAG